MYVCICGLSRFRMPRVSGLRLTSLEQITLARAKVKPKAQNGPKALYYMVFGASKHRTRVLIEPQGKVCNHDYGHDKGYAS